MKLCAEDVKNFKRSVIGEISFEDMKLALPDRRSKRGKVHGAKQWLPLFMLKSANSSLINFIKYSGQ